VFSTYSGNGVYFGASFLHYFIFKSVLLIFIEFSFAQTQLSFPQSLPSAGPFCTPIVDLPFFVLVELTVCYTLI